MATLTIEPEVKRVLDRPPPFRWKTATTPGPISLIVLMVLERWWASELRYNITDFDRQKQTFEPLFTIKMALQKLGMILSCSIDTVESVNSESFVGGEIPTEVDQEGLICSFLLAC